MQSTDTRQPARLCNAARDCKPGFEGALGKAVRPSLSLVGAEGRCERWQFQVLGNGILLSLQVVFQNHAQDLFFWAIVALAPEILALDKVRRLIGARRSSQTPQTGIRAQENSWGKGTWLHPCCVPEKVFLMARRPGLAVRFHAEAGSDVNWL
jgi:hypothetical protein